MQKMCTYNVSFYIPWLLFSDNEPTNTYTWLYKNVGIFADEEYIYSWKWSGCQTVRMINLEVNEEDHNNPHASRSILHTLPLELSLMVKYHSKWLWILHDIYTHFHLMAFKNEFQRFGIYYSTSLYYIVFCRCTDKCHKVQFTAT